MSGEVDIVNPKRTHHKKQDNLVYKIIIGLFVLAVIVGISFYAGVAYQKGHSSSTTTAGSSNSTGYFRGHFGGGHTGIGTVSAISASSITITLQTGGTKTYTINSSTVITDSGSNVTYSDIQSGDTVLVITSSSTSTVATRILVNPSFGGGGFFGGGSSSSSGSSTNGGSSTNSNGGSATLNEN